MLMTVIQAMIRDLGPYSSRNTSKGALLEEAAKIIGGFSRGLPLDEVRHQAFEGVLLNQRTRASRKRIWQTIYYRLFSPSVAWTIEDLKAGFRKGPHTPEFISLSYLHYALRDHLTFDFVTQVLWDQWCQRKLDISRNDLLSFLDQVSEGQPQVKRWTESSRRKLAGSILTALRDFGILKGSQKKRIVKPSLPLSTAEHLLHILTVEGLRGNEVILDPIWRLFLLSEEDIAHVLSQLSQTRSIRFERGGHSVVLETPEKWSNST